MTGVNVLAVNTSSNWSTTSTRRGGAAAAASAGPSDPGSAPRPVAVLHRLLDQHRRLTRRRRQRSVQRHRIRARYFAQQIASSRSGLAAGRITRRGHTADPGPRAPAASRGINPARNSDDLPDPDSPATSSIPAPSSRCESRRTNCSASSLRP